MLTAAKGTQTYIDSKLEKCILRYFMIIQNYIYRKQISRQDRYDEAEKYLIFMITIKFQNETSILSVTHI